MITVKSIRRYIVYLVGNCDITAKIIQAESRYDAIQKGYELFVNTGEFDDVDDVEEITLS